MAQREGKASLFSLGRVTMTTNLQGRLQEADSEHWEEELKALVDRHVSGDWGDLGEEDKQENDLSVKRGFRILSAYTTSAGVKLWIITEADRSYTTCLLPEDY